MSKNPNQPDINLSRRIIITKVLKKTNAKLFKGFKEGHIISIVCTLEHLTGKRGNYATMLNVLNVLVGDVGLVSQSKFINLMANFEYEVLI